MILKPATSSTTGFVDEVKLARPLQGKSEPSRLSGLVIENGTEGHRQRLLGVIRAQWLAMARRCVPSPPNAESEHALWLCWSKVGPNLDSNGGGKRI